MPGVGGWGGHARLHAAGPGGLDLPGRYVKDVATSGVLPHAHLLLRGLHCLVAFCVLLQVRSTLFQRSVPSTPLLSLRLLSSPLPPSFICPYPHFVPPRYILALAPLRVDAAGCYIAVGRQDVWADAWRRKPATLRRRKTFSGGNCSRAAWRLPSRPSFRHVRVQSGRAMPLYDARHLPGT